MPTQSARMKSFYDYFHHRRLEVLKTLLDKVEFSYPLDIGCGGGILPLIGIKGWVGIDTKHGKAVTLLASAENLPFQDEIFDMVFAGEVLEHLYHPGNALWEWARVLKPKGTLIITTPNGNLVPLIGGNPEHKALYAEEDICKSLNRRGLTIVAAKGIYNGVFSGNRLFRLIPFSWAKRWLLRFPVPLPVSYDMSFVARKRG